MRVPCFRFKVRNMVFATMAFAVSWSTFLGIAHVTIYLPNVRGESLAREDAIAWERMGDKRSAADRRRDAADLARRNQQSLGYALTAVSVTALGVILGGLSLGIRSWYGAGNAQESPVVRSFAEACSSISVTILVGCGLGLLAYIALLLSFAATSTD